MFFSFETLLASYASKSEAMYFSVCCPISKAISAADAYLVSVETGCYFKVPFARWKLLLLAFGAASAIFESHAQWYYKRLPFARVKP